MNENINLCEILKDAPKGLMLWSPICGDVFLDYIDEEVNYPIRVIASDGDGKSFTREGKYLRGYQNAVCVLFPSRKQKNWRRFNLSEQELQLSVLAKKKRKNK